MLFLTDKKRSFAILTISLFNIAILQAQEFTLLKNISTKASAITTDPFGSLYTYGEYKLAKYDIDGKKLNEFEDYKSGKITYVDASDPLKTLVYYEDFMVLKVLDKTLSEIASYSLNNLGFYSINAIAHSRDNNFWLFDNANFKLKKVDENGAMLYESENFNMLFNKPVQPVQIIDYERTLYLNDPKKGIFLFDRFGAYQKTIPLLGVDKIQVIQTKILYFKNNNLNSYNIESFKTKSVDLLPLGNSIIAAQIQKDRIYVLNKNQVSIYKIVQ